MFIIKTAKFIIHVRVANIIYNLVSRKLHGLLLVKAGGNP